MKNLIETFENGSVESNCGNPSCTCDSCSCGDSCGEHCACGCDCCR